MVTKTQAINAFLKHKTHPDLASLYSHDMECQVNVAQDKGERTEGEFNGVKWAGYTDGTQIWKSFRVPINAATNPHFNDTEMKWDIGLHTEAVGMTGWNWKDKISLWVAYDFDAITGHSEAHTHKLSNDELQKVQEVACDIPWVTVRHSTSGKGLHIYVFLDSVPTDNHSEHAALARSILASMSALTGYNFESKVDICGGNMWVWHRKMVGTDGLKLIKQGSTLHDIPTNWRDHINVVKGTRKKIVTPLNEQGLPDIEEKFDSLAAQRTRVKLDKDHLLLIKYFADNNLFHWWDADHHMLITHTMHLKQAHKEMNLVGIFETETKASTTHNCFCFPMRKGGWSIRRYSPGCKEHPSWDQDGSGWTRCYFNCDPTLRTASLSNRGLEDPSGGYQFTVGEDASKAALQLGANVIIPPKYGQRATYLKPHKDGRLIVEFSAEHNDIPGELEGWLRKGTKWIRMYGIQRTNPMELDIDNYDDVVRHIVTETGEDSGWSINANGRWINEPLVHVKPMLDSMGLKPNEVKAIVGGSVIKPWTLISEPFKPEYPGDRVWNRNAPQFKYPPALGDTFVYPTWMKILNHIGQSLDVAVQSNTWCKSHGILTGADYLKVWIASMLQFPTEPLPYLFLYGETQNTGKSTLHEALSLLFYPGYQRVDHAILNQSSFNAELEGTILCVIEETDLSNKNAAAYNRVKEWVTSPRISIHRKHMTPYMITNTNHFIQCANNKLYCPIFPGDTRIVMINVPEAPKEEIPKRILIRQLDKEAPDFLGMILALEIPESPTRLRIPLLETQDKLTAQSANQSALQQFITERCFNAPGQAISLANFFDAFQAYLDPSERMNWNSKRRVSAEMPDKYPKGRLKSDVNWHWGNIALSRPEIENDKIYVANGEFLTLVERQK